MRSPAILLLTVLVAAPGGAQHTGHGGAGGPLAAAPTPFGIETRSASDGDMRVLHWPLSRP